MALSWLNLPCAVKAAIGIGKRTLGDPASVPRHRGRSKAYRGPRPNTRVMIGAASPAATPTAALRNRACAVFPLFAPAPRCRGFFFGLIPAAPGPLLAVPYP
jgi:hypothetical protein